ncbi:hypothetical protein MRB53_037792 [Persea americana]|nr:hypothetical protein MRB53_037792 [Persea americana]
MPAPLTSHPPHPPSSIHANANDNNKIYILPTVPVATFIATLLSRPHAQHQHQHRQKPDTKAKTILIFYKTTYSRDPPTTLNSEEYHPAIRTGHAQLDMRAGISPLHYNLLQQQIQCRILASDLDCLRLGLRLAIHVGRRPHRGDGSGGGNGKRAGGGIRVSIVECESLQRRRTRNSMGLAEAKSESISRSTAMRRDTRRVQMRSTPGCNLHDDADAGANAPERMDVDIDIDVDVARAVNTRPLSRTAPSAGQESREPTTGVPRYSAPEHASTSAAHQMTDEMQGKVDTQITNPWDEQIPIIDLSTKTLRLRDDRAWAGRTVIVRMVVGRVGGGTAKDMGCEGRCTSCTCKRVRSHESKLGGGGNASGSMSALRKRLHGIEQDGRSEIF